MVCAVQYGYNAPGRCVSGFVVFSVLGFMATEQGVSVDAVAKSGRTQRSGGERAA